jgi:ABC-type bacteriocin/lantibiotic exporter with double-glycine peptidase domain
VRRGQRIPVLFLIAWILCLDACSLRLTEPGSFPEPVRLHEVDPYSQEPSFCGPYALAAVLEYLDREADPSEIADRIYSPGAGGVLTMDLYLEARRRGVQVRQARGTLTSLYEELEKGLPAIVLLKYTALGRTPGHFIVLTGFSNDPAGFFLLWGDGRLSWMNERRFEGLWSESGFWTLFFEGEDRS